MFRRLKSAALNSSGLWQYLAEVRDGLCRLGDGHLRLGTSFQGVEQAFESNVFFSPVSEGVALSWCDPVQVSGTSVPEPGDLLFEVDGVACETFLNSVRLRPGSTPAQRRSNAIVSLSYQELLPSETPVPKEVVVSDCSNRRRVLPVIWKPVPRNRPTPDCVRGKLLEGGVGFLEIDSFYCRDELGQVSDLDFRRQLVEAGSALIGSRSLIVDLRRNGGGRDQQAQLAASLLVNEEIEWTRYRHRMFPHDNGDRVPERSYLRPKDWALPMNFDGSKLVILIGPGTFSTTEIFVSALAGCRPLVIVGGPSAGGAGNPVEFRLPFSGWPVMIPITEYFKAGSDTERIEVKGVSPSIRIESSAEDIRHGLDSVFEQGMRECLV